MNNIKAAVKSVLSSSKGSLSSKRLMGIWMVLVTTGCLIYGVAHEGITPNISSIMDTYMITGASLLGVDSVASIWKNKGANNSSEEPSTEA